VIIKYELAAADVAAYAGYYVGRIANAQIARVQWRTGGFVAAVGIVAWAATGNVSWFFAFLVGAVVSAWFIHRSALQEAIRAAQRDQWACFGREHTMEITEEGVWSKCEASDSLTRWAAIRDVASTRDHIFIVVQGGGAYPVARARIIAGDVEQFLNTLRAARG
jgi:hypothetical protein